jgi:hypothetical protein
VSQVTSPDAPASALARLARVWDRRARSALRAQMRARRTLVWAGLLALLAAVLCFVPLFNSLGYEFSFVMAMAAGAAAADLGGAVARRVAALAASDAGDAQASSALLPGARLVGSTVVVAALTALLVTVVPLLLICANALRVRQCDWVFGLQCWGSMTLLSAAWAAGVGVACAVLAGPRRVLSNALPPLVLLLCVIHSVWRFYDAPAVFSYNPLVGYWSGNLYDEEIVLGEPFLWSRLHQLMTIGALLALLASLIDVPRARLALFGRRPTGVRFELAACAALLFGAVALRADAGALGFAVSTDDVIEALGGRHETENFVIYYPPGGDIERDIQSIGEDHEFRLAQLVRTLGVAPERKITSFYFQSSDQKARLMGAKNVYMAKPWREEIYVHHDDFPHQVLRHEIAHVVAGYFGDPLFHVSARRVAGVPLFFNVGLIEGIAVAADWPDHFNRSMTPHQAVKAMVLMDLAPPIDRLLSTGFFAFSSARSYTAAGSFVRFLLDRHGAARLRDLYRSGGDFDAAYGRSAGQLAAEWRAMIDRIQLPSGAPETVRERFRRGGIFQRPCPHAVADKRSRAARLIGRGRIAEALEVLRSVCRDAPGEPTYRIDLAELLVRAERPGEASAIYHELSGDAEGVSTSLRAESHLALAAIAMRAGDRAGALRAIDQAVPLAVDDDLARQITAQRFAAGHTGPAADALRAYFWPPGALIGVDPIAQLGRAAAAVAAEPALGLGHYLVGRNLSGRGAAADAARALAHALDRGLPSPLLARECASLLAAEAYQAGDLAEVERAAALMIAPLQPQVTQLLGYDYLERVQWKRTGRVPDRPLGPPVTPAD